MNRKMKAKANNAAARKMRDCPKQGKPILVPQEQTHCECGMELGEPLFALIVPGAPDKSQLH
jgi:hypothetical protein